MNDEILDTKAAGKLLDMERNSVAHLCRTGKLAGAVRLGGGWAIPRRAVIAYKEQTEGKGKHDPTRGH